MSIPVLKQSTIAASDGQSLAVWYSGGTGTPIVFVHGFPESHLCWNKLWKALGGSIAQYRIIAYDIRGFGQSSKIGEASWQRFLRDHLDITSALKLGKYHMVGHDWGGAIGLHVARYFPEHLKSAVVMNTNYWRTDLKGMWHLLFFTLPVGASLTFKALLKQFFEFSFVGAFRDPKRLEPESRADVESMYRDTHTTRFWIRLYRNMAKSILRQKLPRSMKNSLFFS